jgi:lactoylglutathione lyase
MSEEKKMPPEQMSVRLELFVQDMDRAVAFYVDILGFEMPERSEDYVSLRNGTCRFGLGPIARLSAKRGGSGPSAVRGLGIEIVLEVDDVHWAYEHVQASGYPIEEPLHKRNWGLTDFRLVDPDGYYLRITSRT